jgi:nucleoside-diphosphate-sugar epimerase
MIVAITGGTGFIGKKLALRHLELGDKVRVLTRRDATNTLLPKEVVLYFGDLHSSDSLLPFADGADVLYHCAGEIRNASRMYATHVEGTQSLIDIAKGRIGRWVQLSSVGAYGQHREGVITESTDLNPSGEYEITKVASDALVESAALNGAFSYVILRPSNVYGAAMSNQSLFSLIKMIKHKAFFFIGKRGASANYIHVDNVVEAMLLCAINLQANGEIYNLSDCCTLEQFVALIAKCLNVSVPYISLPETLVRCVSTLFGFIPMFPLKTARIDALTLRSSYSTEKIMRDLAYKPIISMENGLKEMVDTFLQRNL